MGDVKNSTGEPADDKLDAKDSTKKIVANKLEDKVASRAARKKNTVHTENQTIETFSKKAGGKDKPISARVNGTTYTNFKKICEARGITSNACLNMLITDFVRENKSIIEE